MLKTAAVLNFLLAIGHLICMFRLDMAFRIYGIDEMMNDIASNGAYLPYLITVIIVLCLTLCGIYALSASGVICRMPLLRLGIYTIANVFLFRMCIGIYWIVGSDQCSMVEIASTSVAGIIGALYLLGAIFQYQPRHK